MARLFALSSLSLALLACGPSEQELLAAQEAELASQAALAEKVLPLDTEPLFTRSGQLSVRLPLDLLAQPFENAIMAASSDGLLRFYLDQVEAKLQLAVAPLKDELIGLGWAVTSEKHYQHAIALRFEVGTGSSHQARAIWLIERSYLNANQEAQVRVVRCESQAREPYLERLGLALRAICQGVQLHPPEGEAASPTTATPQPAPEAPAAPEAPPVE